MSNWLIKKTKSFDFGTLTSPTIAQFFDWKNSKEQSEAEREKGSDESEKHPGEHLRGGRGDDVLIGHEGDDVIRGRKGDDFLWGADGDDKLDGGRGHDEIHGGSGNDDIRGGSGDDEIHGGTGADRIRGDGGEDRIHGGSGADDIRGGSGDDAIHGGEGADRIRGGRGDDEIAGGHGADDIDGGKGDDHIRGDEGADEIRGGLGDDHIAGGAGDDVIHGNSGDDRIHGGSGADAIHGGSGRDTAVFSGDVRDYEFTFLRHGKIFVDHVGGDGADDQALLRRIEVLEFENFTAVLDRNNGPLADADHTRANEDGPGVVIDVLANDFDFEGDALEITALNADDVRGTVRILDPLAGTVFYDPNGQFEALAEGELAEETLEYVVSDGENTATATVTLAILGQNDPVVAFDGLAATNAGTGVDGSVRADDVDGDPLVFSLLDGPSNGSVVVSQDGTYSYVPDAGFSGADAFRVSVSDGLTDDTADVAVTVAAPTTSVSTSDLVRPPDDLGGAQFVNGETIGAQASPSIATLSDGGHVVVWSSFRQDGSGHGIFGQRFDADGNGLGAEFQVNTRTSDDQRAPSVTSLDGGFVVVWQDDALDGSGAGIFGQRYAADGSTLGIEFQVNATAAGAQVEPSVTELAGGGFVVSWTDASGLDGDVHGVFGRLYDASGNALGAEFQINSTIADRQVQSSVSQPIVGLKDGGFVTVWSSRDQDGDGFGIFGQRFDALGNQIDGEFQVSTTNANDQLFASVAALEDGGFVAVWRDDAADGSDAGIFGQRFDASGNTVDDEFQVNDFAVFAQDTPVVAGLADGGFAVAWSSELADGDELAISAKRFDASGNAVTAEYVANASTFGAQQNPAIAAAADGSYLLGWETPDGDGSGIELQRVSSGDAVEGNAPIFQGDAYANTETTSAQSNTSMASLADGGHVVVWSSFGQDGDRRGAFGQLFDADGNKRGAEFQVNTTTFDDQQSPSVASLEDGFVVTWQDDAADGDSTGIFGQRFDAAGTPLGGEFQVNATAVGPQVEPSVTELAGGGFVVSWTDINSLDGDAHGVFGRLFDANGNALGDDFQINGTTADRQLQSSLSEPIVGLRDGGFVAVWSSGAQDGDGFGVFGQRFDALGNKLAGEFQINSTTAANQQFASVGALEDGGFVAVWRDDAADGSATGIFGQRFDASGNTVGGEFQANDFAVFEQDTPVVTGLADGGFVVAWQSEFADGNDSAISAKRFDASGSAVTGEFVANSFVFGAQQRPAITAKADGSYVIAWETPDGSSGGIATKAIGPNDATEANVITVVPEQNVVNTQTTGTQSGPALAELSGGGHVVVWSSIDQDGSGSGVFGQRFDADGNAIGPEFQVNTTTFDDQLFPSVASLDTGFVVTWRDDQADGSSTGIFGQRFDADGATLGAEFQVNTTTDGSQLEPSVAELGGGGFVVSWSDFGADGSSMGVFGQVFDAAGSPLGNEFQINTFAQGRQDQEGARTQPIAALGDGGFVAVWSSRGQDGDGFGVFGQRFDGAGAKIDGEFQINTTTAAGQSSASVTSLDDGGFVAVWRDDGADGSGTGLFSQRFDASGIAVGTEFQVNDFALGDQDVPVVAGLSDGGFLVSWQSESVDGHEFGISAKRFDAGGNDVTGEFVVNAFTLGSQENPAVLAKADGSVVVAWQGPDGSGDGIASVVLEQGSVAPKTLIGSDGNDSFIGSEAGDTLSGGAGDDVLQGLGGDDVLDGGSGRDQFLFDLDWGADTVSDFEDGLDQLVFSNTDLSFADLIISYDAGNALLSDGANEIAFVGVADGALGQEDFLFA